MSLRRTPLAPDPASTKAQLKKLTSAAKTLNSLSDELTKHVLEVENAVNRLGLGITADVQTEHWSDEDGRFTTTWSLRYEKLDKKWGFVIRRHEEDHHDPSPYADTYESWAFKDAPREHRICAVEKIPALLDALFKRSEDVAGEIEGCVSFARNLSSTLAPDSSEADKKERS